jgi:3-oxoacyl-[acyl-carrier protein] reductase
MIDGTIIVRLLERRDPDAVATRRGVAPLPTVDQFAAAIANAANSSSSAGIVYVGGSDYLMTA